MFFSPDRRELRRVLVRAWKKRNESRPLEPLEDMIVRVVEAHPEYHPLLEDEEAVDRDFGVASGEVNPFLHMAMHIAIREQVSTDRPAGIRAHYSQLLGERDDPHALEHAMMECLGRSLWKSQPSGAPPDEAGYLDCIRRLRRRSSGS